MDWLYPALPALGAQPSDIVVLNFAVWLNLEEHYNYHLDRCRGLAAKLLHLQSCLQQRCAGQGPHCV